MVDVATTAGRFVKRQSAVMNVLCIHGHCGQQCRPATSKHGLVDAFEEMNLASVGVDPSNGYEVSWDSVLILTQPTGM
jgi:hypothetical protein